MPFVAGPNATLFEVLNDKSISFGNEGIDDAYTVSIIVFPFLATTFLFSLRLYVRIRRRNLGPEDWLMLSAWICLMIVLSAYLGYEFNYRSDSDYYSMADALNGTIPVFRKAYNVIVYVLSMLNAWFAKLSVVCMLLEHVPPQLGGQGRMRITIWATFGFYSVFTLAVLIAGGASAGTNSNIVNSEPTPPDYESADTVDTIDGWRQFRSPWTSEMATLLSWSLFSSFQDIAYAIIGLISLHIRQRTTNQKVASITLFLLSLLAGIFAALRGGWAWYASPRIWYTIDFDNFDWVMNEGYVLMACGNVPRLMPLLRQFAGRSKAEVVPTTFLGDVEGRGEVQVEERQGRQRGPLEPLEPKDQLSTMPMR